MDLNSMENELPSALGRRVVQRSFVRYFKGTLYAGSLTLETSLYSVIMDKRQEADSLTFERVSQILRKFPAYKKDFREKKKQIEWDFKQITNKIIRTRKEMVEDIKRAEVSTLKVLEKERDAAMTRITDITNMTERIGRSIQRRYVELVEEKCACREQRAKLGDLQGLQDIMVFLIKEINDCGVAFTFSKEMEAIKTSLEGTDLMGNITVTSISNLNFPCKQRNDRVQQTIMRVRPLLLYERHQLHLETPRAGSGFNSAETDHNVLIPQATENRLDSEHENEASNVLPPRMLNETINIDTVDFDSVLQTQSQPFDVIQRASQENTSRLQRTNVGTIAANFTSDYGQRCSSEIATELTDNSLTRVKHIHNDDDRDIGSLPPDENTNETPDKTPEETQDDTQDNGDANLQYELLKSLSLRTDESKTDDERETFETEDIQAQSVKRSVEFIRHTSSLEPLGNNWSFQLGIDLSSTSGREESLAECDSPVQHYCTSNDSV